MTYPEPRNCTPQMHGLIFQTCKTYVIERTDEASWAKVLEHAGIEPRLYLPVSHYPEDELVAILESVAALSGHDRMAVERDFGRTLAPELLQTFRAHWRDDWELVHLLENLEGIAEELRTKTAENDPPLVTCTRTDTGLQVTYRSHRDHPALAHGVLEGVAAVFDDDRRVRRLETTRDAGETRCVFVLEESTES
ncbi:heme NO-binding domain-containing protein [Natrialbaceae archaeon A-CW2]|uniref:heme NO-binding domain-containing protein n=1 Tax=Natronosalvus amylolyticus TaxID=2961994 RepID=UPI0020C9B290|nr:heme NO-binding domain-containing protein [Natronosalvus amylolyticus]